MKTPTEYQAPPRPKTAAVRSETQTMDGTSELALNPSAHTLLTLAIEKSPRQTAQRQRISHSFGSPVQKKQNHTGMPDEVKTKMETHFNTDLSSVRVHTDSPTAGQVGALAYTQGDDVHFAPGRYQPDTAQGKQLLGHELTHVVQQREGRVAPTGEVGGMPVNDDPKLEQEADMMGKKIR